MIPLNTSKTFLSVYSLSDHIFCLRCPPHRLSAKPGVRSKRHINHEGYNIFLFRARAPTVAQDWYLGLYISLKKQRLESLEVHIPGLDVRVRLPTNAREHHTVSPSVAVSATRQLMTAGLPDRDLVSKEEMLESCRNLLENRTDWHELLERLDNRGLKLSLAWRKGMTFDWLTTERSVDGVKRIWDVYTGAIMKQSSQTIQRLEVRSSLLNLLFVFFIPDKLIIVSRLGRSTQRFTIHPM